MQCPHLVEFGVIGEDRGISRHLHFIVDVILFGIRIPGDTLSFDIAESGVTPSGSSIIPILKPLGKDGVGLKSAVL